MWKKIGAFILGALTALLSALAMALVFLSNQQPTTEINGKIKAKRGAMATISTRVEKRSARKQKKQLKKMKK